MPYRLSHFHSALLCVLFLSLLLAWGGCGSGETESDEDVAKAVTAVDTTRDVMLLWDYPERDLSMQWDHWERESAEFPKRLPGRWMDDALRSIRTRDTTLMRKVITEFGRLLDPDTLNPNLHYPFLNILHIDLDNDGISEAWIEIAAWQWADYDRLCCLAKRSADGWKVIYADASLDGKYIYQRPRFEMSDPVIIAREIMFVSSMSFTSEFRVMRVVGDSVQKLGVLPGEDVMRYGTHPYLQHEVEAKIEHIDPESISVSYRYSIYPTVPNLDMADRENLTHAMSGQEFLSGECYVTYVWSADRRGYVLDHISSSMESRPNDTLTTRQLTVLLQGHDPAELAAAFRWELDSIRKSGAGRKSELADYVLWEAQKEWKREAELARRK